MKIFIFSGTSEGRRLAEFCVGNGLNPIVFVATEYGKKVMVHQDVRMGRLGAKEMERQDVRVGRLDAKEMESLMFMEKPELVIDATHPFAREVSLNVKRACEETGRKYLRVLRESSGREWRKLSYVVPVKSLDEAIEFLNTKTENILLTTGSKELPVLASLSAYRERVYLRALPSDEVKSVCQEMNMAPEHCRFRQGPFSKVDNLKDLAWSNAGYLLTKESGEAGGFSAKLQAAEEKGIICVVIERPVEDEGYSLEEIKNILSSEYGESAHMQGKRNGEIE